MIAGIVTRPASWEARKRLSPKRIQAGGVGGGNRDRLQDPAGRYGGRKLGQGVIVETAPGIAGVGDDPIQRDFLDPARCFMRADEQAELLDAFVELTHQVAAAGAEPSRRSISARIGRISSAAALAPPPLSIQTGR